MPLYEYQCQQCKKKFEILQKIYSDPLTECIYCQGSIKKLISVSSFQFKGSGWYITDYKNKNNNNNKTKTSTTTPESKKKDKVESKNVTQK